MRIFHIFVLIALTVALAAAQNTSIISWEALGIAGYTDELTATGLPQRNRIGGEYYQRLSGDYGDWGAIDAQYALSWSGEPIDAARSIGFSAIRDHMNRPLRFELHQSTFELKRLGPLSTLWLGHGEPGFGLEPVLDTHNATLHSFLHRNLGMDKDWGMGGNGFLNDMDYHFSLTTNSGMALDNRGGVGMLHWGFGDPARTSVLFGASGAFGFRQHERWTEQFDPCWLNRLGADFRANLGVCQVFSEAVVGEEGQQFLYGGWSRVEFHLLPEELKLTPQASWILKDHSSDIDVQLELEYHPAYWLFLRLGEGYAKSPQANDEGDYTTYLSFYIRR